MVKRTTRFATVDSSETPSDVVARRVRQLRKARGLTVADLAALCRDAGSARLTEQAIYKLEGQRSKRSPRPVSVDELMVLAYCLDVAPLHLLVPPYPSPLWGGTGEHASDVARSPDDPNEPNDTAPYAATPRVSVPCWHMRQFIRGWRPLPGQDLWNYFGEVPPDEQLPHEELLRRAEMEARKAGGGDGSR